MLMIPLKDGTWLTLQVIGFGPSPYADSEYIYYWSGWPASSKEMLWRGNQVRDNQWKYNSPFVERCPWPLPSTLSFLVCPD